MKTDRSQAVRRPPEILEPAAAIERLGPILLRQWRRVVPLLSFDADGRIAARGTGTLVTLRGRQLVVTAAHVGGALKSSAGPIWTAIPPVDAEGAPLSEPHLSVPTQLALGEPIVQDSARDFVVYDAPDSLAGDARLEWYDGDQGWSVAERKARMDWASLRDAEEAEPFVVSGFGNHAHFTEEIERTELLGFQPLLCEVTAWDPAFRSRRQITMVPDIQGPTIPGLTDLQHRIVANVDGRSARDGEIVGGFSGGPVALVGRDGAYLVGIVVEGGRVAGGDDVRVYATPWDCIAKRVR
jgi:hypothetical protein